MHSIRRSSALTKWQGWHAASNGKGACARLYTLAGTCPSGVWLLEDRVTDCNMLVQIETHRSIPRTDSSTCYA